MTQKRFDKESVIIAKRSAFVMYVEEGIHIVHEYFPQQIKFVEENKKKSLLQVFSELQIELEELSKN
jgi:hypothetical protein